MLDTAMAGSPDLLKNTMNVTLIPMRCPRRGLVAFVRTVYFPAAFLFAMMLGFSVADASWGATLLSAICLSVVSFFQLIGLRCAPDWILLQGRFTVGLRRVFVSDVSCLRIDDPWELTGATAGLAGVTIVLKSGEEVPVLETGSTRSLKVHEWYDYMRTIIGAQGC